MPSPSWMGWAYRLIEVARALTALALVLPRPRIEAALIMLGVSMLIAARQGGSAKRG